MFIKLCGYNLRFSSIALGNNFSPNDHNFKVGRMELRQKSRLIDYGKFYLNYFLSSQDT